MIWYNKSNKLFDCLQAKCLDLLKIPQLGKEYNLYVQILRMARHNMPTLQLTLISFIKKS